MCRLRQVKASAGSGKTYELTRCFLQYLARCGPPSGGAASACALLPGGRDGWGDILAVTFTNAAAAEMRDRVIRRLKSAALGRPEPQFPLRPEAAARWVDVIMRDMSALNIRTIDSLLHLIVRAAALELDLHPDFQPVFTTEEALRPYLDLLLERAWQGDAAMRELLREVCRALARRENSTGFLAGEKLLNRLRPLLDDVLLGRFADVATGEILRRRLNEMEARAAGLAETFRDMAAARGLAFNKNAQRLIDALLAGQGKDSALLHKTDAAALFLKKPPVDEETQRAFENFAAAGRRLAQDAPVLRQALSLGPVLTLARTLAEAFMRNQREEGCLPGLLIPRLARQVLEGEHGVPDALCRLGTRLTHFLVDEFQDTSREQWLALRPLVEEALSRGGSLTWVGDVKQSIYGWRGGEPELFDSVFEDEGLTAVAPDGRRDSLPCNWRSRREIVKHNNAVFAPLGRPDMAQQVMAALLPAGTPPEICADSAARLARAFTGTEQRCPEGAAEGGLVRVEAIHSLDAESLTEDVLDRVCALLLEEIAPSRPWSDVLILVRSNGKATLTADRLAREGIPVITENSLLLAAHPLVKQTVALLSFLDNPDDDISFLTVIRGALFREHPEARELREENLEAWCAEPGKGPLHLRFQRRWPRVWQRLLAPFHSRSGLMTPYDMTLEWYARLQVEKRCPEAASFLRRFMEVLHSAEEKGLATLPTFLEHWHARGGEEKVPMPENMDAVRVMTIHKSKGLEAPVVILPWTNFRAWADGSPVLVERDGLRLAADNRKLLGQPYFLELARQCRENMHMLYVAFTRAQDALYAIRTTVVGGHGSTVDALDLLMADAGLTAPYGVGTPPDGEDGAERPCAPERETPPGAAPPDASDVPAPPEADATVPAFPEDWRPMQWLPQLKIFRNPLAGFAFRPEDRGSLLHLCLEHLHCTGDPEADALAALNFGLGHFALPVPDAPDLRASLAKALRWFASQPETARWLREGWPEHSLMDGEGRLLRMDLLVNEPWGPLVLEYKSGHRDAAHIAQLRSYLACLAAEGAQGTPRGLLVYADLHCFVLVEAHSVSAPADRCADLLTALENRA
ncbi:MAG: DNA helicase UvrD [Desulfovibrio desulfuricans]|jgi:ATP-dependent exoDNAse (exonuclease V) beta subunit|nr:DNA helicase UvrD [Desulfovibrio desulfuricans]